MNSNVYHKKISRHRRKFKIWFFFTFFAAIFLIILLFTEFSYNFRIFKKVKSLIEHDFTLLNEEFIFKKGSFNILLPGKLESYAIKGTIQENQTTLLSFNSKAPISYISKDFFADVFLLKPMQTILTSQEKYELSSDFLTFTNNSIILSNKVFGKIISSRNLRINNIILIADSLSLFPEKKYISGSDILIKSSTDFIKADNLEASFADNLITLSNNVQLQSEDKMLFANKADITLYNKTIQQILLIGDTRSENNNYKISSDSLKISFLGGKPLTMTFQENVKFKEKHGNLSQVKGDRAQYNFLTKQLIISGNVEVYSTKNHLTIKAESFYYNEKTKLGSFKALEHKKHNSSKVEIELDI